MDNDTKGCFIIAGASQGLGAELTKSAINDGYSLALIARRKDKLIDIQEKLSKIYPKNLITTHALDLSDEWATRQSFQKIAQQHQKISVLINCAATWTGNRPIDKIDSQYMKQSLDLNFFSTFNTIKALIDLSTNYHNLPLTIINLGATASLRGNANMAAFAVAKSAVRTLSQSLAKELGSNNIHIGHLIIDGLIANDRTFALNPKHSKDKFISMDSLCKTIMHLIKQDKSCWTFELDVRPFNEAW